jgi:NAD(P)-dependent dehydrogenase (short-subunit alcohol dehydrogenase family)
MPFSDKVAIVTGAAGKVGAAVAKALRARGTAVLAVDSDAEALAALDRDLGGVDTFVADPTRSEDVAGYVARACELWGGVDLFFNNVDVEGPARLLTESSDADFDAMIEANLRPTFLGLKHTLPHVRDGGAVVNMASDLAVVGAVGLGGYVASKHGVLGLTKVAALECERRQIRVNAVCPGRIREVDLDAGVSIDGFRTPEEIADLVIFLLSDGGPLHHRPEAHVGPRAANGSVT